MNNRFRQSFANWPLATKLVVGVMAVLAVVAMLAAITVAASLRRTPEQAGDALRTIAQAAALRVADRLAQEVNNLDTLARSQTLLAEVRKANASYPESAAFARQEVKTIHDQWLAASPTDPLIADHKNLSSSIELRNFANRYAENSEVFATDRYGGVVAFATNPPAKFDNLGEIWWTLAFSGGAGSVYISPPEFDTAQSLYAVIIAVPVYEMNSREVIGILHSRYSFQSLTDLMAQVEVGGGEAMLMTGDGERLDTTIDPASAEGWRNRVNAREWQSLVGARWRMGNFRGQPSMIGQATVLSDVGPADINDLGWVVVVRQDLTRGLEVPLTALSVGAFIGILALIVSVVATIAAARALVRPLGKLTEVAKQAQGGNLDVTVPVESRDEIGQLAEAFSAMISEIRILTHALEGQVAERTSQLAAVNEIAATVSSTLDINEVMARTVNLIRDRLGFYHVSIFLLDEKGEYAVVRESTGEVGRQLKDRGHRLAVGSQSIIGYVTANRKPRISLEVGTDIVHFKNPLLPDTRSEVGLPLIAGDKLLGALDVQSTQPGVFTAENIDVLQNMANQIAVALNNARLFQEAQTRLAEVSQLNRQYLAEAWTSFARERPEQVSMRLESGLVSMAPERVTAGEPFTVRRPHVSTDGKSLGVPIVLRDQMIGEFTFELPEGEARWSRDDLLLAEAVVSQVALAVENARLLEETQSALEQTRRLARRERVITEVTDKISFGADVRRILQIATEELRRATGSDRAVVRLNVPAEPESS
jgi:GAF domain-containing protein/HAMP domain-containing protein